MKRKLFACLFIFLFLSSLLFAGEVVRYVDPDSAVGGDGTTWALAYDSLSDWEAAEQTTLDGDWHHVYCRASAGTADIASVSILGWTQVDADDYILIDAASTDRASASGYDADKYRLEVTDDECIYILEKYVRVSGLQIKPIADAGVASGIRVGAVGTSVIYIDSCYIVGVGGDDQNISCISIADADTTSYIYNTIATDAGLKGTSNYGIDAYAGTNYIYNCVIYGAGVGIRISATSTVKNCPYFANSNDSYIAVGAVIDYCAHDDAAEAGETNEVAESGGGAAWPDDFEGAATGDFRLKSGSNLIGAGAVAPGGALFTDDIEGTVRGETWDLGAFEYVAGGGSIVPLLDNDSRRRRLFQTLMIFVLLSFVLFQGYIIYRMKLILQNHECRIRFFEDGENFEAWYELHKELGEPK